MDEQWKVRDDLGNAIRRLRRLDLWTQKATIAWMKETWPEIFGDDSPDRGVLSASRRAAPPFDEDASMDGVGRMEQLEAEHRRKIEMGLIPPTFLPPSQDDVDGEDSS